MTDKKDPSNHDESRRKLLKTAAAGGALGLKSIPAKWATPVVAAVALPAHGGGTEPCCGGSESVPGNQTTTFTFTTADFTNVNTSETGKYCGPCGGDSGSVGVVGYKTGSSGTASKYLSFGVACGGSDWFDIQIGPATGTGSAGTYTVTGSVTGSYCTAKYGKDMANLGLVGVSRFRFGN